MEFDNDIDDMDDDIGCIPVRCTGMRKMTKEEEKRFPDIAIESLKCQSYHIARFEICNGCDFAITGCERVFRMSAG